MNEQPKRVFVTGASKGVGRGIAMGFADAGWNVAINYHSDLDGANETKAAIEELGRRCLTLKGDVGVGKGDAVHRFYQVSGLIIIVLGVLWAVGTIWS